jgi:hypothetical protein
MAMSVYYDQGFHVGFMWENPPWCDLANSDNLGENNKPIFNSMIKLILPYYTVLYLE